MPESGMRRAVMPAKYVQGEGVISQLGTFVKQYGERPFVIAGRTSFSKVRARVQASLLAAGVPMRGYDDSVTECTKAKIADVAAKAGEHDVDIVIGCGGGKAIDVAKAVAETLRVPAITVPTQCATNADGNADSVIFTDDHKYQEDMYLSRSPVLVLVDTDIVARAPPIYLVQGMGDALSAAFEKSAYAASQRTRKGVEFPSSAALEVNLKCFSTLMAHGVQAKKDVEAGKITESVEAVVEAIKFQSGFGFGGTGCAAAHAIYDGFTIVPGVARKHGEIVAFGTLVQMMLERRPLGEIERVMRWCRELGLPTRSSDLGNIDRTGLVTAAEKSCDSRDTMGYMPFPVTPKMVLDAIDEVDQLARSMFP